MKAPHYKLIAAENSDIREALRLRDEILCAARREAQSLVHAFSNRAMEILQGIHLEIAEQIVRELETLLHSVHSILTEERMNLSQNVTSILFELLDELLTVEATSNSHSVESRIRSLIAQVRPIQMRIHPTLLTRIPEGSDLATPLIADETLSPGAIVIEHATGEIHSDPLSRLRQLIDMIPSDFSLLTEGLAAPPINTPLEF